jgi:hypothetical protein
MSERAFLSQPTIHIGFRSGFSTFKAMVRKELILMARYPVNFMHPSGRYS